MRARASTPSRDTSSSGTSERTFLLLGALSGFVAVLAGAFGAHGLEGRLTPRLLDAFETGARYHLAHSLALVAVALLAGRRPDPRVRLAGWLFFAGVVLFSGTLYLLALTGTGWLGAVTPLGGAAFLAGWLALAASALRPPDAGDAGAA